MKYANIIVDISVEKLDKTFQYSIPENLQEEIQVGVQVDIPFGNRKLTGYVIELTEDAEFDPRRIRPIISVHEGSVAMESQLIALAGWMRKNYGSTMNQALKTVLPIRRQTKEVQKREIVLLIPKTEAQQKLALFEQKHYTAKARLLRELIQAAVGGQIVGGAPIGVDGLDLFPGQGVLFGHPGRRFGGGLDGFGGFGHGVVPPW